ncbi:hypothetical protein JVU11DRAFT_5904 [Chiua virens]|nr:hypothetical protein JVU11DRAFT_5904 [Chiua virens]
MDHIDEVLITQSRDLMYSAAIQASLGVAKRTLNRYYGLTDSSDVYWIAMVLHPHHKLKYFKDTHWKQGWINAAETLVQTKFEDLDAVNLDGGD